MVMKKNYTSKTQAYKLQPGSYIVGKWHKKTYRILKALGQGATGTVYLAESNHRFVALKVGEDNMAIAAEVNVLKHFSKVQGQVLGPSLLDVDDMQLFGKTISFYAMEYLKGKDLLTFIRERGHEWVAIFIVQLLGDLDRLHRVGWVFGDLKPDNLMIVGPPPRVRWFDVGGTTLFGRSIKEFTEFYDRGYWGLGTRKAEPSYDLFAVAMIMVNCYYPRRFDKKNDERPIQQLKQAIGQQDGLRPFRHVLLQALQGKYKDAQMMRKDMMDVISKQSSYEKQSVEKRVVKQQQRRRARTKRKASYLVEIFLISTFLLLIYVLYLYGQLL